MVVIIVSLIMFGCSKKESGTASAPEGKSATASLNMNDGQWEITTTVDMPGMPEAARMPNTVTSCLTKSDSVPKANSEQSECKMVDQKINGNTISWNVVCKETSGNGTITYAGDSFSGLMESTTKQDGKEMKVKMKMEGKRIGACPAK
jgi:hypothetical protein